MANRKPLTNKAGEVRELTKEDFAHMVPFSDLPEAMQEKLLALKKPGRPKSDAPKQTATFRLATDLLAHIKSTGRGYNARVETILREAMVEGRL
jgi:uncharacterized protein (DUF4415 family)